MNEEYKKYINLPISKWPEFEFIWCVNLQQGLKYSEEDFGETNPDLFVVGYVNFNILFKRMSTLHQKWNKRNFWGFFVNKNKIAKIIYTLNAGSMIYAPIVEIREYNQVKKVVVRDGNHRLAVCFAKNIEKIPIIIPREQITEFNKIFDTVEWLM